MANSVSSCKSISGIHSQEPLHQWQSLLWEFPNVTSVEGFRFWQIREFVADVSWIFLESLLLLQRHHAHYLLNDIQLINFWLTRVQRLPVAQLTHYASNGPYVDFFRILISEEKLRGPVPSCGDIVSHVLIPFVLWEIPCKAEIAKLQEVGLWTDQQIFWFDVSMNNVIWMTVVYRLQQLVNVLSHSLRLYYWIRSMTFLTSSPFVRYSKISSSVRSTNSKTRYSFPFL